MGAGYGSAGERCMAISVAVPVGDAADRWSRAEARASRAEDRPRHRRRTPRWARWSPRAPRQGARLRRPRRAEGAELVVDGRGLRIPLQGYENGFFLGGTCSTG
jgi:malonate-semialdehyde dehydrogenase (acetylating) / methylmalonate-semialdehyde dehydrogenase